MLSIRSVVSFRLINSELNLLRSMSILNLSIKKEENLKSWKDIPGPLSLPFFGQLLNFLPGGMLYERNAELAGILYKKYGPIVKLESSFGSTPMIFLYDPEAALKIFRNENWTPIRPVFQSGEYFKKVYKGNSYSSKQTTGLLTDHGEAWKKLRTTVNPTLLQSKTVNLYTEDLKKVAKDMVKRIKSKRNENNIVGDRFDVEMYLWALESIGVIALSRRLNCFDTNLKDSPERKMIRLVQDVMMASERLDFQPSLWRYIATPGFKKAMRDYEDIMTLSEYFVNKAIEQLNSEETNDEKGVLEKLLEIDRDVAITVASDMILAGVDTTANAIIAIFYQLAKNSENQNKLRAEIISNQERQSYLTACIKEAMRIMPVVGGNFRQTSKEYSVLGYRIPKDDISIVNDNIHWVTDTNHAAGLNKDDGTYLYFFNFISSIISAKFKFAVPENYFTVFVVVVHQYLCSMDKHFIRPTEFIPERWIVDRNNPLLYKNTHPFVYRLFGYGVRSCIGRRIAELELQTFVSEVVKHFQIEWFGPPPKTRLGKVNYLVPPYNFVFKDI